MNKHNTLFTILLLVSNSVYSQIQEVFPSSNKCENIIKKCDNRADSMCKKRLCGSELSQYNIDNKIESLKILGKPYTNVFTLEDSVKKSLPEFKLYTFRIIDENTYIRESNDPNKEIDARRVNIVVDQKNSILAIKLY